MSCMLYLLFFMSLKAKPLLLRCFPLDSLKSQTEKNVSLTQWNILMIKASVDPVFHDWHLSGGGSCINESESRYQWLSELTTDVNHSSHCPPVISDHHTMRHHETPGELWSPPTMISNNGESLPPATTLPVFSPSVDQYS